MELLQESIIYLEKRIKGINFDLAMTKLVRLSLYSMTIIASIALCILVYVFVAMQTYTFGDVIAVFTLICIYIWWI